MIHAFRRMPRVCARALILAGALTLTLAVLLLSVAAPGIAEAQSRTCGAAGLPACPSMPPVPTKWSYTAVDQAGLSEGVWDSLDDAKNALIAGATWACYLDFDGQTELPTSVDFGGPNPGYFDGSFEYRDVWRQDFHSQTKLGGGACAGNIVDESLYLLQLRGLYCPNAASVIYQSAPPVVGPYCPMPSSNPPKMAGGCSVGSGSPSAPGSPGSPPSNTGGGDSGSARSLAGNPCDVSNGNKYQPEVDVADSGNTGLQFVRSYNSLNAYLDHANPAADQTGNHTVAVSEPIGAGWTGTYFQSLTASSITDSTGTQSAMFARRPDGRMLSFILYSGVWNAETDVADVLTQTSTGYRYQTADDTVETYDTNGVLQSVTPRGKSAITVAHANIPGFLPSSVSDAFGHVLSFTYARDTNHNWYLTTLTDAAGQTITYAHAASNNSVVNLENLTSVSYQDGTTRGYAYGGAGTVLANHLTQVTDESTTPYAFWSYDATGMTVLTSQHAGGVESYQFAYSGNQRTVTDPLGTLRTLNMTVINGVFRTASTSSTCGGCSEDAGRTFDAGANMLSRTDFNGNQTTYAYDTDRNLETSRTEAYGTARARTITTTWNATWHEPALITEPHRTTAFTYDSMGNVLTKTLTDTTVSPNVSRTWTYTYNGNGQVLTIKGPRTDVSDLTTYTYYACTTGSQCGRVDTVTDAAGHVTTYLTYNAYGQPLTITDPNGVLTTLTYDARLRLTSRVTSGETTSFTYYPTGLLEKVTLPDASNLQYTYDAAHRLTQITDGAGNKISYTLDGMGNHTAENSYDPSSVLHRTHSRVINSLNQLYQDVNAAGTAAVTTTYTYDSNGNQTAVNAPLTRNTANQYDELNRLKQITDPGSGVTQFAYDANDNLTAVTDPRSLATGYTYNGLGDLTQQGSPDTGTTTNTYDSAGNLATSTSARGAVSTYAYDVLNRVTSVAYSSGGVTDQTIGFGYDAGTYGKGRLTGASDANHALTYVYDALGRITSKTQVTGSLSLTVGYGYTSGDLTTVTTPSGRAVVYGYNSNHQITSVAVNGTTIVTGVTYEPFGAVDGWSWGNGTATSRSYDADGNVTQISSAAAKSYSYDSASRITGITDGGNAALSWGYGYDALDRVNSAATTTQSQTFTYDANGNRLAQGGSVSSTFSVASGSNQLSGVSGGLTRTYAYDAAGNTTGYAGLSFTYNAAGRMTSATNGSTTTAYLYNALGQRIKKSNASSTTYFAYDEAGHLLGEYDGMGSLIQEIIWLGDTPIATVRLEACGFSIFYIHTDHLNTPRRITRRSTTDIVWSWESDPFGTSAANENPSGLGAFSFNLRFPGQYYDAETGLNDNYYRDYDPATGGYIESDPIGLDGGLSTYGYVGANPVSFTDPFGLEALPQPAPGGPTVSPFPRPRAPVIPFPGRSPVPVAGAGLGILGQCLTGIGLALTPSEISPCQDAYPPEGTSCPDNEDRCARAISDARRFYDELRMRSIPQYMYASRHGLADTGHHVAIQQGQTALRNALNRVRMFCKVLPVDLQDMDTLANQNFPVRH